MPRVKRPDEREGVMLASWRQYNASTMSPSSPSIRWTGDGGMSERVGSDSAAGGRGNKSAMGQSDTEVMNTTQDSEVGMVDTNSDLSDLRQALFQEADYDRESEGGPEGECDNEGEAEGESDWEDAKKSMNSEEESDDGGGTVDADASFGDEHEPGQYKHLDIEEVDMRAGGGLRERY